MLSVTIILNNFLSIAVASQHFEGITEKGTLLKGYHLIFLLLLLYPQAKAEDILVSCRSNFI